MTLTTQLKMMLAVCTFVITPLLCLAQQAHGALIASDAFSVTSNGSGGTYSTATTNSMIFGQNPTAGVTGFSSAWSSASSGATSGIRVETAGLSHPLALGNLSGDWHVANNISSGQVRTQTRVLDAYNQAQSEYYASSLLWANSNGAANSIARMGLGPNTGRDSHGGIRLEWGYENDDIRVWVDGVATTVLSGFTLNETYLMTLGVEVDAVGANERVTATLFNSAGTQVTSVQVTDQDFSIADLDYLRLNAQSTSGYATTSVAPRFDNFRFGTTLGDVMFVEVAPIPEPASLTLLGWGAVLVIRRRRQKNRLA